MTNRKTTPAPVGETLLGHATGSHPEATPVQTAPATSPTDTPPPAKRNRSKAAYLILRRVTTIGGVTLPDDGPDYWTEAEDGTDATFEDTAGAVRHIRDSKMIGRLRVVAVKWEKTAAEEQVTRIKMT